MASIRINLFNKFIVAFISVGVLPVLFVSFYSATLFRKETYSLMEDNYRQAALYSARNLDSLIEKYNTITKMLYSYNPDNNTLLRGIGGQGLVRVLSDTAADEVEKIKQSNEIITFLYLIHTSDTYITNVVFATSGGSYYAFGQNNRPFIDESDFLLSIKRNQTSVKANQLQIISTHLDSYFQKSTNQVFTIGRNYIDLSYPLGIDRVLGTLYIDISIRCIDDIFRHLDIYQKGSIAIFDSEDNLIYGNPVYYNNHINGNRALEITGYCENTPWRVILTADFERVMRNMANLIRLISGIAILVLIALLVISVFYSKMFSRPVRLLLEGMKKIEEGDFKVHVKIKAHDEIGQLADGFYQMAARLEEYIQTSFIAQIRRKEAELSSLKARIKPHFLYNSLELIRMNAIVHEDESTAELAFLLAEQMRFSIEPLNETVDLSRELDMIRSYFTFVDLRYRGAAIAPSIAPPSSEQPEDTYNHEIAWEINCDSSLGNAQVLSLTIQPIVENAVIHGIKPKGQGHIRISVEKQGGNLIIAVRDDGMGMDENAIQKLISHLKSEYNKEDGNKDSVGLKNVHDRIRYKYGEAYGLSISGALGQGVSVIMTLPLIQRKSSVGSGARDV
jgi:two-component system sensor histidine kinase YesM